MGATSVLIRKELRQHWLALIVLAMLLVLIAATVLLMVFSKGASNSVFLAAGILLQYALPGAAMVITGRLVLAEYRAKTQLFLEALPLSRWRMVAVKYCLGLGALLLFVVVLLAGAGAVFSSHEAITPRFAGILASRACASAFIWYSFFFTTGLLGRYRWPIFILIFFVGLFVDQWSSWEAAKFGPFELLNGSFGSERHQYPVATLKITLAAGAGLTLGGFALALLREGNVSALLAERMSHREKVFVAAILLGGVSALTTLDASKRKAPYDLTGAASARESGVIVKVAGPEEEAKELADALVAELGAFREYLDIKSLPPILVTHREDLDAGKYERGELSKAEGFVVRANYTADDFNRERFVAWLLPELLDYRSHDRTTLEPGRWIRDGIGEFWVRRARVGEPLTADRDFALRALYAAPAGVHAEELRDWYRVRERVGEGIATGLAWSGLKVLALAVGEEKCRNFLREMYSPKVPNDVRATIHDLRQPWPERLQYGAGFPVDGLVSAWNAALANGREELAEELGQIPRLSLRIKQDAATDATTLLKWRLAANPAPAGDVEYRIRYLRLPGLDVPIDEDDLMEEAANGKLDVPVEKELAESFSRGTRAVIGAAVRVPSVGCDVISGWQRIDVGP